MANITRYDPFSDLDDVFKGFFLRPVRFGDVTAQEQKMKIDVREDEKAYTVEAEIPGVKKEDIKVSVDGNVVSISAEVKREREQKEGDKVVRSERYYGSVSRSFSLSTDVDEASAQARYKDGVLELVLPKKSAPRQRQIAVN